jgi:serine/threonine protein kinase
MPLNPGDTLLNGQYRILRLIGRGGFGSVYQAEDQILGGEAAIKELIPSLVGDEATLKRFLSEAKATMRLTHERIVRTHNVFSERGNYYIVMEFIAGGSLEARLQKSGPLSIQEAVRLAAEVCEGLSYAHQRGVVHCDLKPANILFTDDGQAKVADFGIAHVSEQLVTRTWRTSAGFVAGTLPYMSPEQVDGVRDDPRIDIYALGAVIYIALTRRPYLDFDQRETPGAQADNVYRLRSERAVAPSGYNSRVPPWMDSLVLKALSKDLGERFASTAEMRAALLQQGAQALPARATTAPEPAEAGRTTRTSTPDVESPRTLPVWLWPAIGGAAALIVILGIVLAVILRGQGDKQEKPTPTDIRVVQETRETFVTVVVPPKATAEPTPTFTASPAPPTETSSPTPEPPTPTLTPDLSAGATESVFYYTEGFEDPSSGWSTFTATESQVRYVDGEYEIAIYQPDWVAWGAAELGQDLDSFGFGVYASLVAGPADAGFGLLFRYQASGQDFYQLEISGDGYYRVVMLLEGEWVESLPWEESEAINQGLGAINYLEVICLADLCSFSVNDIYLTELFADAFTYGNIGVFAHTFDQSGAVVRFDNVIVLGLDE